MPSPAEVVCFGDLMLESIHRVPRLPAANSTLVLDGKPRALGGSAFNVCWYLSQWGWHPRLVSFYGLHQEEFIKEIFAAASVDDSGLIPVEGETDLLVVLVKDTDNHAIYLCANLPTNYESALSTQCGRPKWLILTGSRHAALRRASQDMANSFNETLLAFCPSYAIYEYRPEELRSILERSHLIAINEYEASYICTNLNFSSNVQLAESLSGYLIVTRAHQGVHVYHQGEFLSLKSYSNTTDDVIGAGDTFFAGFLHVLLQGGEKYEATRFAALAAAELVNARQVRTTMAEDQIRQRMFQYFG